MPRGGATAYGSLFVCHYAEGGATKVVLSVRLLQAFLIAR